MQNDVEIRMIFKFITSNLTFFEFISNFDFCAFFDIAFYYFRLIMFLNNSLIKLLNNIIAWHFTRVIFLIVKKLLIDIWIWNALICDVIWILYACIKIFSRCCYWISWNKQTYSIQHRHFDFLSKKHVEFKFLW